MATNSLLPPEIKQSYARSGKVAKKPKMPAKGEHMMGNMPMKDSEMKPMMKKMAPSYKKGKK